MKHGDRQWLFLTALGMVLGWAVFWYGGVRPREWNVGLLALGGIAIVHWFQTRKLEAAPPLEGGLRWAAALFPAYVAFQLVPLPVAVLHVLSPARAEVVAALGGVGPLPRFAALSVVPPVTAEHFMRVGAYTIVFLLIREATWRAGRRMWASVLPVVAVAALEAALGLWQYAAGSADAFARGTYINKNHLAGLLEMALPFAIVYPIAVLRRVRSERCSPGIAAVKASAGWAVAALILLAIIATFSRMGFIAALGSLFVMGALALRAELPGRRKWIPIALLALVVVLAFVFMSPDRLVRSFARMGATDEVSADLRLQLWKDTPRLIAAYPLFGCGLGGYQSAFLRYQTAAAPWTIDFAHNDYLQLLAELGAIGFLMAAAILLNVLARAVRAARSLDPERRFFALACTGAIAAILLHSLVDFNLYIPANAMILAWILGLASGPAPQKRIPAA